MKFYISVDKLSVFYFFIQNLAEWHFSNQRDYNTLWRKELGQFSPDEESAIKRFKEIHLRYSFGKLYLGKYFFLETDPWTILRQNLPKEDFAKLENIFSLLAGKFDLFWSKEIVYLNRWQKELDRNLNGFQLTKSIIDILKIIFNTSVENDAEVKIHLLSSSTNHTGGGASIGSHNITVEASRYSLKNVNHVIGIIWHETIHACFQNQYFFPLILERFSRDQKKIDLINEITIGSLFPRGILGMRLLKNRPVQTLLDGVTAEQTIKLLNLTKEYVNNPKPFDETYIQSVAEILKI
jgi:hypothetical protein